RLVRCAYFAQLRTGRFNDFADAKAAADLYELAARNDDFTFFSGEMPDNEDERGGAIVDNGGRLCAANESECAFQVSAAMPAVAAGKIIFKIRITNGNLTEQFHGFGRERRAPEIGMNNNTGAVDDGLQTRTAQIVERGADAGEQ